VDVRDDQVQGLDRARRGAHDPGAHRDRAGRPGRGQLHDAELLAGADVEVHVEARLLGVEGLGAVHVRDRDRHQLELEIHAGRPFGGDQGASSAAESSAGLAVEPSAARFRVPAVAAGAAGGDSIAAASASDSMAGLAGVPARPRLSRIDSRRAAPSTSSAARSTSIMRASTELEVSSASPSARA
jgi:hypothetical protein